MTQYHGGKFAYGKKLSSVMSKYIQRNYGDWDDFDAYIEPFVGMAGVMRHIPHHTRVGADRNTELISMWNAVKRGWLPEKTWRNAHVSEREYKKMKKNPKYRKSFERGFAKFAISYGGQEWAGYMVDNRTPNFNFGRRGNNRLAKVRDSIKDVRFVVQDFLKSRYNSEHNSVFYLDPPYEDSTGYRGVKFDHDLFWQQVEQLADKGNVIFVSEMLSNFPSWVKILWKKKWKVGHGNPARANKRKELHVEALGVVDFN